VYDAVVPTLQRSPHLRGLLDDLVAHPLVEEVLVVNNAAAPLGHGDRKVRVVQPGRNIFVNPAWNLGVAETTAPRLAIVNDDVRLPPGLLEAASGRLDRGAGLIGADESCFSHGPAGRAGPGGIRFRVAWTRSRAFGTCLLLDRASWVPVPDDLQVYFGDDWVFRHQHRRNYAFSGVRLATWTGTTASSAEFAGYLAREAAVFGAKYDDNPYLRRHRLAAAPDVLARRVHRAARRVGRGLRR
jgi:hypothetical protein